MQFKVLALAGFAACAAAQSTTLAPDVQASLLMVLATALPPSDLSSATADPGAFESAIISSIAAGKTPSWYQALPSDVKSILPLLYPATTPAATTPAVPLSTGATGSSSGLNSTAISTVSSPTLKSSSTPAGSSKASSAGSSGAAALPTAAVGAGIAGAMGFLGLLAL